VPEPDLTIAARHSFHIIILRDGYGSARLKECGLVTFSTPVME